MTCEREGVRKGEGARNRRETGERERERERERGERCSTAATKSVVM
jgi:hypothetical protein